MFMGKRIEIRRLALNFDQVQKYNPPPNPAKVTDSRFTGYQAFYGDDSWELDALEPRILVDLIEKEVNSLIDKKRWNHMVEAETKQRNQLEDISEHFDDITTFLEELKGREE